MRPWKENAFWFFYASTGLWYGRPILFNAKQASLSEKEQVRFFFIYKLKGYLLYSHPPPLYFSSKSAVKGFQLASIWIPGYDWLLFLGRKRLD